LYLYPSTTSIKLLETIAKSALFHNYFDMPIQHISDEMLRIMKRGFGKEKTLRLLNYMRSLPDAFIRTSFIAGHPGENEAMFEELCDFAESFGFDRMNIFSYSDEEGTDAYDMTDKIDTAIIDARAQILGEIAAYSEEQSLQNMIGRTIKIVIDKESDEHEYLLSARALLWAPDIDGEIYVNDKRIDEELELDKIYHAEITGIAGKKLLATVAEHA
jgi:ribosomal protein S12 methylthiotransferase